MRSIYMTLPFVVLAACATPNAPQQNGETAVAAPFNVPMDPGLIQCGQLSNPSALAAATDWTMGQARAAALSGRVGGVPSAADISVNIASYCRANQNQSVRSAASALGY